MLKGTKVMIMFFVLATFIYLINVVMIDDFLYSFTSGLPAVSPTDSYYTGDIQSSMAQLITFIPILLIGLGIGYNVFSRVFGQESQDWSR
jgi:hypothetical protein